MLAHAPSAWLQQLVKAMYLASAQLKKNASISQLGEALARKSNLCSTDCPIPLHNLLGARSKTQHRKFHSRVCRKASSVVSPPNVGSEGKELAQKKEISVFHKDHLQLQRTDFS